MDPLKHMLQNFFLFMPCVRQAEPSRILQRDDAVPVKMLIGNVGGKEFRRMQFDFRPAPIDGFCHLNLHDPPDVLVIPHLSGKKIPQGVGDKDLSSFRFDPFERLEDVGVMAENDIRSAFGQFPGDLFFVPPTENADIRFPNAGS